MRFFKQITALLAALVLLLGLAGCKDNDTDNSAAQDQNPMVGTWKLFEYKVGDEVQPADEDHQIVLVAHDDGQCELTGSVGADQREAVSSCSWVTGQGGFEFTIEGDKVPASIEEGVLTLDVSAHLVFRLRKQ